MIYLLHTQLSFVGFRHLAWDELMMAYGGWHQHPKPSPAAFPGESFFVRRCDVKYGTYVSIRSKIIIEEGEFGGRVDWV